MSYDPDEMMLELFRAEVESHSESLTNALLRLEQSPESTGVLDGMMRAAHSIKGAARIVRVDAAVDVAHVMEDCFVAAQRGELVLESSGIDVLLKSVDLLIRISEASKTPNVDWTVFDSTIKTNVEQLRRVLNKKPLSTEAPIATAPIAVSLTIAIPKDSSPSPNTHNSSSQHLVLPKMLGAENAEALRIQLIEKLYQHADVSLDLRELHDLDAIGLAWLHSASQYARTQTKQVSLINPPPSIATLLDFVGLSYRRVE